MKHLLRGLCHRTPGVPYYCLQQNETTVLPAKSDSDAMLCLQLLSKTQLELARIDRSIVCINPIRRIGLIYRWPMNYKSLITFLNKTWRHCHFWLAGQYRHTVVWMHKHLGKITINCFWLIWFFTSKSTMFQLCQDGVFLGWTSTKQGLMCLAYRHNAEPPVRLKPATYRLMRNVQKQIFIELTHY